MPGALKSTPDSERSEWEIGVEGFIFISKLDLEAENLKL